MTKILIVSMLFGLSTLAWAGEPADALSEDESALMCAEALPKQLACKDDFFCDAMVKLRTKGDKKADLTALKAKCLEEISVDGAGDVAARKDRCTGWIKRRPMSVKRADAQAMDACWSKPTCKDRIDCWAPLMGKLMASAPKKK